jgi:cbb3-type cytochrome oxidase maturation protein
MTKISPLPDTGHSQHWGCRIFLAPNCRPVSVIIILIIASICVAGTFLAAFLWSVKTGQFDDDYTPSVRMLFDDPPPVKSPTTDQTNIQTNP